MPPNLKTRRRFHRYPLMVPKDPEDPKWVREVKDSFPSDILMASNLCLEFAPCDNCDRPVWRTRGNESRKKTWTHFLSRVPPYSFPEYHKPCSNPTSHSATKNRIERYL